MNRNVFRIRLEEKIYILTVIIAVLFMILDLMIINTAILSFFLIILIIKSKGRLKVPKVVALVVGFIVLLLIHIIIEPSEYYNFQNSFKEISRFIIYIWIILIISNIKVRKRYFYRAWSILFFTVLVIAVFQFFKVQKVNDFLVMIYGESRNIERTMLYQSIEDFRTGSIFLNSNSFAKFNLSYLAIYLGTDGINSKGKKSIFILLNIVLAFILAGSRTGMVVSVIMILYLGLNKLKKKDIKLNKKVVVVFIILMLLGSIFTIFFVDYINDLRVLQVIAGLDNSLNYKYTTFSNLLNEFTLSNILIGLGNFEKQIGLTAVDFDLGFIISIYGGIGVLLYILILINLYKYNDLMINKLAVLAIFLFGLTGGIFLNLRIFSIYIALIFTNINEAKDELNEENYKEVNN